MMRLPEALSRKFEEELTALEESLNMPYITSVERIAEQRGEARGRTSVPLKLLARVCGPLPEDLQQRVRQLSIERLEALAETVLDFRRLEDVQGWLDAQEEPRR